MKPDLKYGADAEAGFYKEIGVMTAKARFKFRKKKIDFLLLFVF